MDQRTSFLRGLAWFVSVIFHPIFLFTWLVFLTTVYFPDLLIPIAASGFKNLILVALVSTAIVPALLVGLWMVLIKKSTKLIDMFMQKKEDRQLPTVFLAAYYASLAYVLFLGLNNIIYIILVALVALLFLISVINFYFKISNHASAAGAAMGVLLSMNLSGIQQDLLIPVLVLAVVSGLVISARLFLNAHNPKEVYSGYLLGIFTSVFTLGGFYFFQ